jgi:hypothetical protein
MDAVDRDTPASSATAAKVGLPEWLELLASFPMVW